MHTIKQNKHNKIFYIISQSLSNTKIFNTYDAFFYIRKVQLLILFISEVTNFYLFNNFKIFITFHKDK